MRTKSNRLTLNPSSSVIKSILVFTFSALASLSNAQENTPLTLKTCTSCHGDQGQGNELLYAPAIGGQQDYYIESQLNQFRMGLRGTHDSDIHGQTMKAIADNLSEADIRLFSRLFSELPPAAKNEGLSGNVEQGEELYQSTCMSCHGTTAQGNKLLRTPNLKILDAAYISRQIAHFSNNQRGKDIKGNISAIWMRSVSTQIDTENQIQDIAAYLNSLR